MNGWNLKITTLWKGESFSKPTLHDFGFQPFIFRGVESPRYLVFLFATLGSNILQGDAMISKLEAEVHINHG